MVRNSREIQNQSVRVKIFTKSQGGEEEFLAVHDVFGSECDGFWWRNV